MERMRKEAKVLKQIDVSKLGGNFFGPAVIELNSLDQIEKEVFGPILHIVRYDPHKIEDIGAKLAAKGYGLTLGVHSRLDSFAEAVMDAVPAGNVYVNRTIVGAVVGVQPFGGACRAPARRPAARTICRASPKNAPSATTSPPAAAIRIC
jgi:RHH-type proline utilization regulon transcriptional repressor/proline dehydrogenase/delta 1-pyrroline-5-carboxylate dehydrogenase